MDTSVLSLSEDETISTYPHTPKPEAFTIDITPTEEGAALILARVLGSWLTDRKARNALESLDYSDKSTLLNLHYSYEAWQGALDAMLKCGHTPSVATKSRLALSVVRTRFPNAR